MKNKRFLTILIISFTVLVVTSIFIVFAVNSRNRKIDTTPNVEDFLQEVITSSDPIPSINPSIYSGNHISDSPFVGRFTNTYVATNFSSADDVFSVDGKGSIPVLEINSDGSFILLVNAFEIGMIEVKGTATVSDTVATFSVTTTSGTGFLGDDIKSFKMRLVDENNVKYDGEQIGTITSGDLFTRN